MIVVDSNVIAYLYPPGDHAAQAEALLEQDADWAASMTSIHNGCWNSPVTATAPPTIANSWRWRSKSA